LKRDHKEPIDALTGLRFFAAIFVAISHGSLVFLPYQSYPNLMQVIGGLAGPGMAIFFVLSGFVIYYNYADSIRENSWPSLSRFFIFRFSRLYPLYVLVLSSEYLLGGGGARILAGDYSDLVNKGSEMLRYLTMTQTWTYELKGASSLVYQFGPVSQVSWSISTEWFFYLAFPLVAWALFRIVRARALTLFAICLGLFFLGASIFILTERKEVADWAVRSYGQHAAANGIYGQDSFLRWVLYFSPYSQIFNFIIGCAIAKLHLQMKDSKPGSGELVTAAILIPLSLVCLVFVYLKCMTNLLGPSLRESVYYYLHANSIFTPMIGYIMFACSRYKSWLRSILSWRPFVWGGEASYSIYLLHMLIIPFIARALAWLGPKDIFMGGTRMVILLLVLTVVSRCLYLVFEVPAQRFLRKKLWHDRKWALSPGEAIGSNPGNEP
jgi:peptidoglycan/LPS O-acetylase OafA/YrhL